MIDAIIRILDIPPQRNWTTEVWYRFIISNMPMTAIRRFSIQNGIWNKKNNSRNNKRQPFLRLSFVVVLVLERKTEFYLALIFLPTQ